MKNELSVSTSVAGSAVSNLKEQTQLLDIAYGLAERFCGTELVPSSYRNKPADGAVAIAWGAEIGLQPLQAMQNIAVINGNPSLWGDSLIALVKGSGLCEYIKSDYNGSGDSLSVTVTTKRKGEPEPESRTFSWSDAVTAGLANRGPYKSHPKRMLQNRARSHVLRDVYADILKGFKVREIEEEDQEVYGTFDEPKDITPKRSSLMAAVNNSKPKPKAKKLDQKPVVNDELDNAPEEHEKVLSDFQLYQDDINNSEDLKQLNTVAICIGNDSDLSEEHKKELREMFTAKRQEF